MLTNSQFLGGSIGKIAYFSWMKWISFSCFLDSEIPQPKKGTAYIQHIVII